MSNPVDLERWKAALLSGPDYRFFELIRAVFGEIQTPFNKHTLLSRLITYLNKQETRDRILALVSPGDSFLLTAILVLDSPGLTALYTFVKQSMRYLDLHNHLLNLEERMLIYRNMEDGEERIRFNPLLEDDLRQVVYTDLVFESHKTTPEKPTWLRDELILSVIAFVREKPEVFTSTGALKSRIRRDLKARFSFQDTADGASRVQLLIRALIPGGLLTHVEGKIEVILRRLTVFGSLEYNERAALLAGGLAAADPQRSVHSAVLAYAKAALVLLDNLREDRAYPATTLERLVLAGGHSIEPGNGLERLTAAMESLGLLTVEGEKHIVRRHDPEKKEAASCVIQPNFEATLTGSVSFSAAMELALGAELQSYDTYPVYEITRDSAVRRFADGVSAAGMKEALEKLSGRELPPNLLFSLDSWEREFQSVRVFSGLVLLVDEDRRHLVEHSSRMAELIASVPAPGVYLLHTDDHDAIEKALQNCGIDHKPAAENARRQDTHSPDSDDFLRRLHILRREKMTIPLREKPGRTEHTMDVRKELFDKLDSMKLSNEVRQELIRVIEKGLILHTGQLEYHAASPRERQEAKGFDYLGKVRIVEQALSRNDLILEITTRSSEGNTAKHLVRPIELQKSGSDLILICAILPDQKEVEFRVRSLSLVRSVRGSHYPRHSSG